MRFLFADAEILEDIVQCILAGDALTKDRVEAFDDGTEIFGNEVTGELRVESKDNIAK